MQSSSWRLSTGLIPLVLVLALPGAALATELGRRVAVLEEVVVTAQRREQRLLDAPLSVSALSGSELESRGISSIKDLQDGAIPSLQIVPFSGRASAVNIAMRGIESGDPTQISQDPAFGMHIDGVYLGRVQGLGLELMDIERIEVMRGPQGTLFGRNSIGGAMNIISRRPTGGFGLRKRLSVGNFDARDVRTDLDLPRVGDVSFKLNAVYAGRDGWVRNPFEGSGLDNGYDGYERYGFRGAALWEPNDRFDVLYAYEKSRDKSTSGYPHIRGLLDDREQARFVTVENSRVSRARMGSPLPFSVAKVQGHTLTVSYDLTDAISLKSITGYRTLDQSQNDQWAGSFFGLNFAGIGLTGRLSEAGVDQKQFSQELQLLGSSGRLDWVLGAFYFEEDADDFANDVITQRFRNGGNEVVTLNPFIVSPTRASTLSADSRALFAQVTWTPPVLEDRLSLTAGARYTDDSKSGALTSRRGVPPSPPIEFEFSSSRIDPAVTVAYQLTDEVNAYVRWATAYRAGGANSRSTEFNPFAEEEVSTWELGLKSEFWNRRARLNVAAYRSDYKDRWQVFFDPMNISFTETLNSLETARVHGVEADFQLIPLPGLDIVASYAYTDVDLPLLTNPFDPEGEQLELPSGGFSPKHAASGAIGYEFEPMSFGTLRLHLDANYSGGFFIGGQKTDSYVLLNGRVSLSDIRLGRDGIRLQSSLWVRNITNKEYNFFAFPLDGPGFVGADIEFLGRPRTYGLELSLSF